MSIDKKVFKFARKVLLKDLEAGAPIFSADYTFIQEGPDASVYQLDLIEEENKKNITFEMKPGVFKIEPTNMGLVAVEIGTQKVEFLETSRSYEDIIKQIDAFYNNLKVYEKLGIKHPRRGLLLHSSPGSGKSAALSRVSELYSKERKACVLVWPSDAVKADSLESWLTSNVDWSGVDKLLLILEDIGGGADIYGSQHSRVPASLLNFLDGISDVFQKPTFIAATTNNADALLDSLTSRPGRFDTVLEVKTPNAKDRIRFLKFFAKEDYNLTKAQEDEVQKLTDGFSIAHLKEVFIRSAVLNKTMMETATEIKSHIKKVKEGLTQKPTGSVGFGADPDDEFFDD